MVETVCFLLLGMPDGEIKEFAVVPDNERDHIGWQLGFVPEPDTVIRDLKMNGNDTVFNAQYSIDSLYRRITPGFDAQRKKHALFFGCSIAFGEGLNDDQTLPYQFQACSQEHNAYNYAYSGYGTNQMLARLQFRDLSKQVEEKDGVAFYIFFWDHIYRTIGSMSRYTDWLHAAPNYELENGRPVRNGSFKTGRWSSWWYERIYQLGTVRYFGIDFPLRLNDGHYELLCAIIEESKREYQKQFGNAEFYVVLYPSYLPEQDEFDFHKFKRMLKDRSIRYIDMFHAIEYGPQHTFRGDGHPNAETTGRLADILYRNYIKAAGNSGEE